MFDLQLFADTLTSSYDLVLPFQVKYYSAQETDNKTIKIPNPKSDLSLADANNLLTTLNTTKFLYNRTGDQYVMAGLEWNTTPYTESKQTITLDLNEESE